MRRSVGSGRTAFEHSAATFPGVSAPSSVVRSMHRIARSSGSSKPRGSAGACAMGPVYARSPVVKNAVLRLLGRARLLAPTYRAYERVRATQLPRAPEPAAADGLPVPPAQLIFRVSGTPDAAWFLESGRLAAESIREALARADAQIEAMQSILDFGCGCGRVIRNWAALDAEIVGSDLSGSAIDWCRENLSFARFETNGLSPPLAIDDASIDLAYALSVLTHLPEAIQHEWMDELYRVVRPGSLLLLTTHGERYLERLDDDER